MKAPPITRITATQYSTECWPKIADMVKKILLNPQLKFSQAEFMSLVYKVVGQNHSNLLFDDLIKLISNHLEEIKRFFLELPDDQQFGLRFAQHFIIYRQATFVLSVGFNHLEKNLLKLQKHDGQPPNASNTLVILLNKMFGDKVILAPDHNFQIKNRLSTSLQTISHPNYQIDPNLLMTFIKGLYSISREYADLNPQLFEMYIPCLRPTRGLQEDSRETNTYLTNLQYQGFPVGNCFLKRKFDSI
eukprot:TRINITY_DN14449_c0_g1_i1.p1 TRINITY_DN14449_c0_g1~~TRINITY_DN14449_c0_g1_i1.p1  ORF type:complete len:246 (-),score=29.80 TRINITY_DN14449_c0_g1_i1:128-865(-)